MMEVREILAPVEPPGADVRDTVRRLVESHRLLEVLTSDQTIRLGRMTMEWLKGCSHAPDDPRECEDCTAAFLEAVYAEGQGASPVADDLDETIREVLALPNGIDDEGALKVVANGAIRLGLRAALRDFVGRGENRTELTPAFDEAPMPGDGIMAAWRAREETIGRADMVAGGSFMVSLREPADRTLQLSIGSSGERVTVETPKQQRAPIDPVEGELYTLDGFGTVIVSRVHDDGDVSLIGEWPHGRFAASRAVFSAGAKVLPCERHDTIISGRVVNVECACGGLRGNDCPVLNPPKE
jgi:hypothetical protein